MKKGFTWSEEEKLKRKVGMVKAYQQNPELKEKTKHVGTKNGRYIDGRASKKGKCENCGKEIDIRSKRCCKCRSLLDNSFKNRNHSKESRKLIGKRSKEKFTEEYMERLRKNHEKRWFDPINCKKTDNRIENLFLYTSRSNHLKGHTSIFLLTDELLNKNIIVFKNGKYFMNSEVLLAGLRGES
ncbi:hypothetical protein A2Z67_03740 [Candidatus Woesebacteria bacterium RBG_13_36_22]|uniref:Uncharacterized protein n=1 Tax=Candidatus Woesebacteria bacterium RBG_13_36_22 TaxID=1802478 RepID=A0A1F7WZP2_9BACT|nr:MAG: hypothetical protein A2Z67_03740 [Candidatus Woesebacteria bacterium RBG_13_36_22]